MKHLVVLLPHPNRSRPVAGGPSPTFSALQLWSIVCSLEGVVCILINVFSRCFFLVLLTGAKQVYEILSPVHPVITSADGAFGGLMHGLLVN